MDEHAISAARQRVVNAHLRIDALVEEAAAARDALRAELEAEEDELKSWVNQPLEWP